MLEVFRASPENLMLEVFRASPENLMLEVLLSLQKLKWDILTKKQRVKRLDRKEERRKFEAIWLSDMLK